MGLFKNLGRRVERFKRDVEDAAAEEATHECGECGERLYADRGECPECGSDAVVAIDRE